jgi:hypothetical protein
MRNAANNAGFVTQADRIEQRLRSNYAGWVAAYELADIALQYCARISAIRKKLNCRGDIERIENKTEWVNGQCHGSYRIVKTSDALGITPVNPKPLKSWDEIVRERNEKLNSAPEFELTP